WRTQCAKGADIVHAEPWRPRSPVRSREPCQAHSFVTLPIRARRVARRIRRTRGPNGAETALRVRSSEEAGVKLWILILAAPLVLGSAGAAQESKPPEKPQNRPTLGPEPGGAPSLYGPHNSTTNDARRLLRVQALYVERTDNHLRDKLLDPFAKAGRFRLTDKRTDADAVLRGTCFDSHRLKPVHTE